MKIKYVTLTGADNNTDIRDMIDLSLKYPFVEWGILFSQSKSGVPRYPTDEWVEELAEAAIQAVCEHGACVNMSAHLCGKWVDDAFRTGRITFLNRELMDESFDRVQLNCYKEKLKKAFESDLLWEAIDLAHRPVILGGNYTPEIKQMVDGTFLLHREIYPLFDASGGHGNLPQKWPEPFLCEAQDDDRAPVIFCGYAGGLGPENITEEIDLIAEAVGEGRGISADGMTDDINIWIDMETKLRSMDDFDLEKCEQVLKAVEPWVG